MIATRETDCFIWHRGRLGSSGALWKRGGMFAGDGFELSTILKTGRDG